MSTHTINAKPHAPRHRTTTPDRPAKLAIKWLVTFRWHLLALFLSELGASMIARKYDAFTTDNAYSAQPKGKGIPRFVDWIVRRRDTHIALRQRLEIVTSELTEATLAHSRRGNVRLVSGPVGLGRDLRQVWARLSSLDTNPEEWLEIIGVDIDASRTVTVVK